MSIATAQIMAQIPLFSKMDDEERGELLSIMTECGFKPGEDVMKAGEEGSSFHIIEQGEVEIWLTDSDGRKVVLDVLGPGKFFGELSMLTGETRSASATSSEELVTLELDRDEFFAFLRRRPEAALDVLAELGQRLKHTDQILRTRASRNANDAEEGFTFGQRLADKIASFGGSWKFIIIFAVVLCTWIVINSIALFAKPYDPYPYILLNLVLSCLAAIQAPVIMMSQNRQASKDRLKADLDYEVNVKAELEMSELMTHVRDVQRKLGHIHQDILRTK